jgi:hypothetical protein
MRQKTEPLHSKVQQYITEYKHLSDLFPEMQPLKIQALSFGVHIS